ncbi:uncharacterized protein Triagg1_1070 [Trichoderma aggressivum f. europaeum]|uniref:Ankyrin repeat protein n=1 Tax=Trichoderma aggressivum f. europaeum TaxID=173218 RepID=A0AAE1M4Q4_9HYPO|nr:hypothetical protein Triagg1_1070 [Trichoderma aggressivum f. europaeum]
MMTHEHPDIERGASNSKVPLAMAIDQYNIEVMEVLLSPNSEIWVSIGNVSAAVRSGSSTMLGLLLNKLGDDIMITEDIVEAAAGSHNASALITLLLEKRGHEFKITKQKLRIALANESLSEEVNALLEDRHRRDMNVVEGSVALA